MAITIDFLLVCSLTARHQSRGVPSTQGLTTCRQVCQPTRNYARCWGNFKGRWHVQLLLFFKFVRGRGAIQLFFKLTQFSIIVSSNENKQLWIFVNLVSRRYTAFHPLFLLLAILRNGKIVFDSVLARGISIREIINSKITRITG